MLKKLPKENMGTSNLGWLESRFHFSFAEYRNPNNINFGVLRVLNDDIVHPRSGFDMHPTLKYGDNLLCCKWRNYSQRFYGK